MEEVVTSAAADSETLASGAETVEAGTRRFPELECFVAIAREYGLRITVDRIVHDNSLEDTPIKTSRLLRIIRQNNCHARAMRVTWDHLPGLADVMPALLRLADGSCFILLGMEERPEGDCAVVFDPGQADRQISSMPREALEARWKNELILVKRRYGILDEERPFNLKWFIPELWRERKPFRDVIVAAVSLIFVSLAMPIFFQLVVDKVLVHQSVPTLFVLSIGAGIAVILESVFGFLRRYIVLFATQKIDVRVTMKSFTHLLRLPINFFETQSAGVLTKHMQQLDVIREFLTGRLLLGVIDVFSLIVFLPALLFYSLKLTLLVLAFAGVTALFILAMLSPFRERLQRLYAAEGERQSLLVETIHGMQTVKALSLEPQRRNRWEGAAVRAVETNVNVGVMSASLQLVMEMLQKGMIIAVIAVGAFDVFAGTLTVGALIAFQMLANRVAEPLIQLVSLMHEYQETALSVRMLGNIMNHPMEPRATGGARVAIAGEINFDGVTFRYWKSPRPSLDNVSFFVPAGQMLGIVGKSGSGKTTITKLLQGLHYPQTGSIRIDGIDTRELDLNHLRSNIGVVLQESFLFHGSIRDNISISVPSASDAQIFAAAKMAGADEFINRLPQGYDTEIEEGAPNLSGGQKQRLSIARALVSDPRILIFDEATSSLDPESEAILHENLEQIRVGRSIIIVSHRLATLVDCDSILVLSDGKAVGQGRHHELLHDCAVYLSLWSKQNRHVATVAE